MRFDSNTNIKDDLGGAMSATGTHDLSAIEVINR